MSNLSNFDKIREKEKELIDIRKLALVVKYINP
jgi:hypothetical protein